MGSSLEPPIHVGISATEAAHPRVAAALRSSRSLPCAPVRCSRRLRL